MGYAYRGSKTPNSYRQNKSKYGQRRNNSSNRKRAGQYIDPARFVRSAQISEQEAYKSQNQFKDFSLNEILQVNLNTKGFVEPSPIQDQVIQPAIDGQDVIGIAGTGTGKTAAFALPILQRLMSGKIEAALIVAPTRELAQQIESECKQLGKGSGLFGVLLIGGTSMSKQLRELKYNPKIVIGTPGRIKDHIDRGSLNLNKFNLIALDEVDRMLDMGFINDVTYILNCTNQNRQSLFFSATMDDRVRKLINNFSDSPLTVSIKPSTTSDNVHQDIVKYQTSSDKLDKLHDILLDELVAKVILFDETQRKVERLSRELAARGFDTDAIHGGKTQGQRQRALRKFKRNEIKILVATDVAARGIDVSDITHVINYSVPQQYDDYIHRIGRAGRAGQVGYALTFIGD